MVPLPNIIISEKNPHKYIVIILDGYMLMKQALEKENFIQDKSQLLEYFNDGIKTAGEFKIGLELEKLGVNSNDYSAAIYYGNNGICEFLKDLKKSENWEYIFENDNILGLKGETGIISLEPGSQLEFSSYPQENLHIINNQLCQYNKTTSIIGEKFGIIWLGYGIQPLSSFEDIKVIPKERYRIMTEYLPTISQKPFVMMRESASIQTAFDYSSETDAIKKFRVSLALSPIVSAMFANSPIRAGKDTGYKSYRTYGWFLNDRNRTGLVSKKLFTGEEFTFADYAEILLDLPMMFLKKEDKWFNMNGLPFREYLKLGYNGYKATFGDWLLHINSFFPDVRLNNYLELRSCDCQRSDLILAFSALWKGLIYNDASLDAAWDIVGSFSFEELEYLSLAVAKTALDTEIRKFKVLDLAKELLNISENSLKAHPQLNQSLQDESIYLEKLKELISSGKSPADIILDHWYGDWNKNLGKLVEYSRLS